MTDLFAARYRLDRTARCNSAATPRYGNGHGRGGVVKRMRTVWRTALRAANLHPLFGLLFIAAAAAAEPGAPAPPRNAEAEAAAYERCMKLAQHDAAAAPRIAEDWQKRGGAHPADHCAAVALIGLKRYKEAAGKLEALAQAMKTAPASLQAEALDQAGQAWLLAGDAARAYAAAGAALTLQPND